jgi:predicted cupin superfamily sugar epimerase
VDDAPGTQGGGAPHEPAAGAPALGTDPARSPGPEALIAALGLVPHPEGGWYAEVWRAEPSAQRDADGAGPGTARGAASTIHFLLRAGEVSAWHRVDATEIWAFHAGSPLELAVSVDGRRIERHRLGVDVEAGARPQVVVPAGAWQSARSLGSWTLVGCVVAPAFSFDGFELAPPGWEPSG